MLVVNRINAITGNPSHFFSPFIAPVYSFLTRTVNGANNAPSNSNNGEFIEKGAMMGQGSSLAQVRRDKTLGSISERKGVLADTNVITRKHSPDLSPSPDGRPLFPPPRPPSRIVFLVGAMFPGGK